MANLGDRKIEQLVDDIYAAAMDPAQWSTVLSNVGSCLHANMGQFFLADAKSGTQVFEVNTSPMPGAGRAYRDYYQQIDPRLAQVPALPLGEWYCCHEHLDDRYVAQSEFYQDFLIPNNDRYMMGAVIARDEDHLAAIAWGRGARTGCFDGEARHLVEMLYPHLRRAAIVHQGLMGVLGRYAALAEAVDAVPDAFFALDSDGRIVEQNRAATGLLERYGRLLGAAGGRLLGGTQALRSNLEIGLKWCRARRSARSRDQAQARDLTPVPLAVPRPDSPCPLVVLMLPIAREVPVVHAKGVPVAIVWVIDTAPKGGLTGMLRRAFSLTESEARVAAVLSRGSTLEQAARELAIARTTVKSHVQSIYGKTGCRRQSELTAMVARLEFPLS